MIDETEGIRRKMVENIKRDPGSKSALEFEHGKVWDTNELAQEFTVESFMAPFVVVIQKETGMKGTLMFQHHPRYYFSFNPA